MADVTYAIDLTAAIEQLRNDLRDELLAELRDDQRGRPEWMAIETAAAYMDVPVERLRKLKERGAIPHYQEGPGCRIFFRRSELDDWMATFRRGRSRGAA